MILTYDPSKVSLMIAGYKLPDIVSITATPTTKKFKMVKGIRGTNTRLYDKDSSYTITVEVLQTSITNNVLSQIHVLDVETGAGRFNLTLQDNGGESETKTLLDSTAAYVEGFPEISFSSESRNRVWTIVCLSTQNVRVGSNYKAAPDIF